MTLIAQTMYSPAPSTQRGDLRLRLPLMLYMLSAMFMGFLVLQAPIRYVLELLHLNALAYLPKLLLLATIVMMPLLRPRVSPPVLIGLVTTGVYLVWGMVNLPGLAQALFGLWVLVPMLFGLWVGAITRPEQWCNLFLILFVVTAVGVFLNPIMHYPWDGQMLSLHGKTIQISRQWTAMGLERFAGFARASYSAAAQLLLFGIMLVALLRGKTGKLIVWLIAGLGIALTTTKGPMGAWLLVSVYYLGGISLRWPRYWTLLNLTILACVLLVMVLLPLSTLWIHYAPSLHGYFSKFLFSSFGSRLNWMWPDSLKLLDLGGAWHWWVGRGLGGIGAAQKYFEPTHALAADNFFVYVAVCVGLPVALILLFVLWWRIKSLSFNPNFTQLKLPVLLALVAYGVVVNEVEGPLLALFWGISLAKQDV